MKKLLLLITTLSSVLLLTACAGGGTSSPSESAFVSGDGVAVYLIPSERMSAPDLTGKTLDGSTYSPAKKITVVNVWASWCAPCRAEAPLLQDFSVKRSDVSFVGILTRDNLTSAASFVKRFNITYPTLIDDSILAKFRNSLVPNAIPTTLIIDAKGRVAARISGEVRFAQLDALLKKVAENE